MSAPPGRLFALEFDDEKAKVTIENSPNMAVSNAMTLECMVCLQKECTGYIIAKKQSFALAVKRGQLMVSLNNTRPGWVWKNSKISLELNVWTHVAFTYACDDRGGELIVFVNGQVARVFDQLAGPLDSTAANDLFFGVHLMQEYITGAIANVRIWKRALSRERILELANELLSPAPNGSSKTNFASSSSSSASTRPLSAEPVDKDDPDLIGWWPLDKGYGKEAIDIGRFKMNGQIQECTWNMYINKEVLTPTNLSVDFKTMVNNPIGSDIKLRVGPMQPESSSVSTPSAEELGGNNPRAGATDENPTDEQGQFIYAHRVILATRCKFFNALFTSEMKERNSDELVIQDMSFSGLKKLIEFIYTDHVEVDGDSVMELFTAADKYDLQRLKDACEMFMIDNITVDNVAPLLDAADRFSSTRLRQVCLRFFMNHFFDVLPSDGFMSINKRLMQELFIEAKRIRPTSEEPASKRRKLNEQE